MGFMKEAGFVRGRASLCVFWHRERNIRAVVHGDDFTVLARERDLTWIGLGKLSRKGSIARREDDWGQKKEMRRASES